MNKIIEINYKWLLIAFFFLVIVFTSVFICSPNPSFCSLTGVITESIIYQNSAIMGIYFIIMAFGFAFKFKLNRRKE